MKKIYYGKAVYNAKEINAVVKILKNSPLTLMDGKSVKIFEKKIARLFGKKFGLMVNSGSSANLLALQSLNLRSKSEIITPTLTFSTTVAPIYQLGLIPYFIDVEKNKFVANINQIEKCINKRTKAIFFPNLLGNVPNWAKIKKIAKKYNLKTIEDSADTIGYKINGKSTGKLTDITTCSFYASHVITAAGFGGIVCFNDRQQYLKAKLLRGWGRSSATFGESEKLKNRFRSKIGSTFYDGKYIFSEMGYNFLPSEISAAFGLEQLKKLKKNLKKRRNNFFYLTKFFSKYSKIFNLPKTNDNIKTGWLAYPITLKTQKFFTRNEMQIYLEKKGIQTRTIFTGNILRQPLMKNKKYKKHNKSGLESDKVMKSGILLGCHHGLKTNEISYMCSIIENFIKKKITN